MKLRHLDFRKIGVNCRYIQEMDFKHNDMPMALFVSNKCYAKILYFSSLNSISIFLVSAEFL